MRDALKLIGDGKSTARTKCCNPAVESSFPLPALMFQCSKRSLHKVLNRNTFLEALQLILTALIFSLNEGCQRKCTWATAQGTRQEHGAGLSL